MKKLLGWIAGGLAVAVGFLATLLKVKSDQKKEAEEDAAQAEAVAQHSQQNAEALAAHHERVDEAEKEREERDERIEQGDADSVIADIVAGNNKRVSDDG